jgi:hypothetical protein
MEPHIPVFGMAVVMGATLVMLIAMLIAAHLPYMLKDKSRFNSTADWTAAPEVEQETPTLTPLTPYDRELITSYLEAGETLEGFTRGFFVPARPVDWKLASGLEKLPLLVAATSRRMLLFEVTLLTVHRYCFIPYDEIEYLRPPKPGILGTSGRMRFGLKSGREYQMGFLGPLFSDEGMRQEQSMAAYFRFVAQRFALPPAPDSSTPRAAA